MAAEKYRRYGHYGGTRERDILRHLLPQNRLSAEKDKASRVGVRRARPAEDSLIDLGDSFVDAVVNAQREGVVPTRRFQHQTKVTSSRDPAGVRNISEKWCPVRALHQKPPQPYPKLFARHKTRWNAATLARGLNSIGAVRKRGPDSRALLKEPAKQKHKHARV